MSGAYRYYNDVYIANFDTGNLFKYRVVLGDVEKLSPTGTEIQAFNKAKVARSRLRTEFFDVPTEVAPSAYKVSGASYLLNNTSDYYFDNKPRLAEEMRTYTESLIQISGDINNVQIEINLRFSDESTGVFEIVPTVGASIALKIVKLFDADNNAIPTTLK